MASRQRMNESDFGEGKKPIWWEQTWVPAVY